jgi:L-lactate dehydrogenase complex protein LldE
VRGIDLVELEEPQGVLRLRGTFAVKNPDESTPCSATRFRHVLDTRAEVCAAADNSCLMHIAGPLAACGRGPRPSTSAEDPGGDE